MVWFYLGCVWRVGVKLCVFWAFDFVWVVPRLYGLSFVFFWLFDFVWVLSGVSGLSFVFFDGLVLCGLRSGCMN
jgi:hypothetical protein